MRAFGILSLAAAAAFSLVPSAFAAPLVDAKAAAVAGAHAHVARIVDVGAKANAAAKVHARAIDADAKAKAAAHVHARDDQCQSILVDLKVNLGVQIDVLNGLTAEVATKDKLTVVLKAVVSIIADATVKVKALIGTGIACDPVACAGLLADILIALCGALGFVLTIVADVQVLLDVIVSVGLGSCLCELISALLQVVAGLLVCLVPLVLSLVDVLLSLGLDVVGQLLTIC